MANDNKEMNADGLLNKLLQTPTVIGYIVFNSDGIEMRYKGNGLTRKKAVHYAALMTDYWQIVKKTMNQKNLKHLFTKNKDQNQDCEIECIRFRTEKNTELILTSSGEYFIVCIQNCGETQEIEEEQIQKGEKKEEEQEQNF